MSEGVNIHPQQCGGKILFISQPALLNVLNFSFLPVAGTLHLAIFYEGAHIKSLK